MENNKRQIRHTRISLIIGVLLILNSMIQAAGLLKPVNGNASQIKMKDHRVSVVLNNGFARTEVDQIFVNNGDRDLEALYSFPIPDQASLSELSLWIDGKEVIGEVVPKPKARKLYQEQKAKGNHTAIAEQNGYKTFDVSVSPVVAGQETRVRLVYYQPLNIELNVARYVYPLAEGGTDEERIAFWQTDDEVVGAFSFEAVVKSAFPIKDIRLPKHQQVAHITTRKNNQGEIQQAHVAITEEQGSKLSTDIVLYYRLKDDLPGRIEVIPFKEAQSDEGTFMAVVTPAASLKPISQGTDWTFVLDISGSMRGGKIQTLAEGFKKSLRRMRPEDRFRVILFNNKARDLTQGFVDVNAGSVDRYIQEVMSIQANGGTSLYAGLKLGLKGVDADRPNGVILVTDGVANVGPISHSDFLTLMKMVDIRLFTFVIGNGANRPLMKRLAEESNGFAMNVSDSDDIIGRLLQAQSKVLHQAMRKVKLNFRGERVFDLTPDRYTTLYRGEQLVVFGKYRGSGKLTAEFQAIINGEKKKWSTRVSLPEEDLLNPEIERMYGLSKIEDHMRNIRENGENGKDKKAVIETALAYSLVSEYTSMLVLNEHEKEEAGIESRNSRRVERERKAQQIRKTKAPKTYQPKKSKDGGMFKGVRAPRIGGGGGSAPLGLVFVLVLGLVGSRVKKWK